MEVYLLHAVHPNQAFSASATHRLERIGELRSRAAQAGVAVRAVEQHGDPAEIIELHTNARDVNLIVMGAGRILEMAAAAFDCGARVAPNDKAYVDRSIDDDAEAGFSNLLVAAMNFEVFCLNSSIIIARRGKAPARCRHAASLRSAPDKESPGYVAAVEAVFDRAVRGELAWSSDQPDLSRPQ